MAYLTRSGLETIRTSPQWRSAAQADVQRSPTNAAASVFLSHSHDDRDLVDAVTVYLGGQGVSVYVDWRDPNMPAVTSPTTALALQRRIIGNRRFLLLATDRSMASRWVPWELGYADGVKRHHELAVLPVLTRLHDAPTEYVGIDPRVELSATGYPLVYAPGATMTSVSLAAWLAAP